MKPHIDSFLVHELTSAQQNKHGEVQTVPALLQFAAVLGPEEIRFAEQNGVQFIRHSKDLVHVGNIYLANLSGFSTLDILSQIGLIRASSGTKRFYPSITTSVPAIGATSVQKNLKRNGIPIDGSGSLVAVLDTGVAWLHPSFWRVTTGPLNIIESDGKYYVDINNNTIPDETEGPIAVVHQQNPATIEASNEYMYIDVNENGQFNFEDGDRWLAGVDKNGDGIISLPTEPVVLLGESKVAILYDQYSGNVYVRGVNLTTSALSVGDEHGHGSHVAAIIAGGQPGYTDMVGVAPGADLLVIRSPLTSADVLDAIAFAAENNADIINMSFSSFLGFLDGTDIEDLAVTEAMREKGLIATVASGNLGGTQKHAFFKVSSGSSTNVTFRVLNPPTASFLNVLWYSCDDNERILLHSPNGETIDIGVFGTIVDNNFAIDTDDLKAYVFPDTSVRGTNRVIIQLAESDHMWASGVWTLEFVNPSGESIDVNAYVWAESWNDAFLRFTSHISNLRTVSSPGTADLAITVGACNDALSSISSASGRGPRIDGVTKPEVVAPGESIRAASNNLANLWYSRSGTSMAAPHVAGVLALVHQAADNPTPWLLYSAVVQGAGGLTSHREPPSSEWGFGPVNALASIRQIMLVPKENSATLSDWAGVPESYNAEPEGTIPENLDIIRVSLYPTTSFFFLAITTAGAPNFNSSNILTIQWDADGDDQTGPNGFDLEVNFTAETLQVFLWNGNSYVETSLSVSWWYDQNSTFLVIEHPTVLPSKVEIRTSDSSNVFSDSTDMLSLTDIWRPTVASLSITEVSDGLQVTFSPNDIDSPLEQLNYEWAVVDGKLSPEQEGQGVCDSEVIVTITTTGLSMTELPALLLNISDPNSVLHFPLLVLTRSFTSQVQIVSAVLDSDVVAVGPFIESIITGEIIIDGYLFVEEVELAIYSHQNFWLNFTLHGDEGIYPVNISVANFAAGDYEVYAIVTAKDGEVIQSHITTLHIVADYSRIIILAGLVIGVIVIIKLFLRLILRRKRAD